MSGYYDYWRRESGARKDRDRERLMRSLNQMKKERGAMDWVEKGARGVGSIAGFVLGTATTGIGGAAGAAAGNALFGGAFDVLDKSQESGLKDTGYKSNTGSLEREIQDIDAFVNKENMLAQTRHITEPAKAFMTGMKVAEAGAVAGAAAEGTKEGIKETAIEGGKGAIKVGGKWLGSPEAIEAGKNAAKIATKSGKKAWDSMTYLEKATHNPFAGQSLKESFGTVGTSIKNSKLGQLFSKEGKVPKLNVPVKAVKDAGISGDKVADGVMGNLNEDLIKNLGLPDVYGDASEYTNITDLVSKTSDLNKLPGKTMFQKPVLSDEMLEAGGKTIKTKIDTPILSKVDTPVLSDEMLEDVSGLVDDKKLLADQTMLPEVVVEGKGKPDYSNYVMGEGKGGQKTMWDKFKEHVSKGLQEDDEFSFRQMKADTDPKSKSKYMELKTKFHDKVADKLVGGKESSYETITGDTSELVDDVFNIPDVNTRNEVVDTVFNEAALGNLNTGPVEGVDNMNINPGIIDKKPRNLVTTLINRGSSETGGKKTFAIYDKNTNEIVGILGEDMSGKNLRDTAIKGNYGSYVYQAGDNFNVDKDFQMVNQYLQSDVGKNARIASENIISGDTGTLDEMAPVIGGQYEDIFNFEGTNEELYEQLGIKYTSTPSLDNTPVDPSNVNVVSNQIKDATLGQENVFDYDELSKLGTEQDRFFNKTGEFAKYKNMLHSDIEEASELSGEYYPGKFRYQQQMNDIQMNELRNFQNAPGVLPDSSSTPGLDEALLNMENIFDEEGNVIPEDSSVFDRFNRTVFKKNQLGNAIPNINY